MSESQEQEIQLQEPVIEESPNGAIIYLDEIVADQTLNPIIQFIMSLNIHQPETEHITIFIDSPGGDVKAAMKLIDVMNLSRIPIRTIGWGGVASAALLIFMCGHERLISESAEVLSHQATLNVNSLSAKINDFESQQKEFQNICNRLVKIYQERTGMSPKDIHKKLMRHHDVWLTGEEALAFGMADDLLQNRKDVIWEMLAGNIPVLEDPEGGDVKEDDQVQQQA